MALSLSVFNPEDKARFEAQPMNQTFSGYAINMMRATMTSMEDRGMTETSSVMRFFTTAGTLAVGIVAAPAELVGRAALGFVEGLIYCMLKEGNHEGAEFFKEQAITQAKAIMVAAKIWVFFSNPIFDIAYVIYNLLPDSYQNSPEAAEKFFESKMFDPNRLSKRNFICQYLDQLGRNPDAKAVENIAKRIFIGLLSYAIATVDSGARVVLNVVAIPVTKLTQVAGSNAIRAYNIAATSAVHAYNHMTGMNKTATQFDADAFAGQRSIEMTKQAKRIFENGVHLGILYNPVAIAFEILEYASEPMLSGKAFDAAIAASPSAPKGIEMSSIGGASSVAAG